MTRATVTAVLVALALLMGAGHGSANDFKLGPDDVLDIVVWNNKELSRTVPVRPDGRISLPLINDVQAAGLTPMQLRDVLTRRLGKYMTSPEVSVVVKEVHSFAVSVMGEVRKAGRYELKTRATVLDAIAAAGGFTEFASRSKVSVLRNDNGKSTRIRFNYNKGVSGDGAQEIPLLRPGDVVVVP
jgi:polysaccharide export outer membrane protein